MDRGRRPEPSYAGPHGPRAPARRRRRALHPDHAPEGAHARGVRRRRRGGGEGRRGEAQEAELRPLPLRRHAPRRDGLDLLARRARRQARHAGGDDERARDHRHGRARDEARGASTSSRSRSTPTPSSSRSRRRSGSTAPRRRPRALRAATGTTGDLVGESPEMKKLGELDQRARRRARRACS